MCESDIELAKSIKEAFEAGSNVEITIVSSMNIDCVKAMKILKGD